MQRVRRGDPGAVISHHNDVGKSATGGLTINNSERRWMPDPLHLMHKNQDYCLGGAPGKTPIYKGLTPVELSVIRFQVL